MSNVYILVGAPGSGKSSFSKTINDACVCSADDYFIVNDIYQYDRSKIGEAHAACLKKFVLAIVSKHENVIVDNTNTLINDIIPYYSVAKSFDAKIYIKKFHVSLEDSFARNLHQVPKETCQRMIENISKLQFPKSWKFSLL